MDYGNVLNAFLATLFTWGMTALGAGLVFFFKSIKKDVLDMMLGFAAGIMIAASFWSLLAPALSLAEEIGQNPWLMATAGFLGGGVFLFMVDRLMPHMHLMQNQPEGHKSSFSRSVLLVLAITIHNIPEGLAVGVAFGAAASGDAGIAGAIALALGIGLQNFPEGAAVSIPLRRDGMSRLKSFLYGQASGLVEPIAAIAGAILAVSVKGILPFALSFAAGAMIYVVVEELIPEAQSSTDGNRSSDLISIFTMIGCAVMMVLDVSLG